MGPNQVRARTFLRWVPLLGQPRISHAVSALSGVTADGYPVPRKKNFSAVRLSSASSSQDVSSNGFP
ncbi:hypothetical protein KFK09_000233 [Dendrobium nobile]|uniref:Uncharacterized protein n=1 Tax=Dendrobium nobile TaxID=94219 RepID=A0A8T3CAI3_DENNO|nr:hypothetical protein KFK09_000233 [Dendrobium nobile]